MEITLTLTIEEANTVLAALGQLPTNTGVYPLLKKIKAQGEEQLPPPPEQTESPQGEQPVESEPVTT